jgi:hypothetical protein
MRIGNIMSRQPKTSKTAPEAQSDFSLLHFHVCVQCGGASRREKFEGRALTSGIFSVRGLKRRARKRKLVIDNEMKEVLERLLKDSHCDYVFTSPQDPTKPLGPWVLEEQIGARYGKRSRLIPMPACTRCGILF